MFTPSQFQSKIFEFIKNGSGNAVINAVAGSGKTTTIVKSLELLPTNLDIWFLAFNKAIVEELKTRVPSHVNVSTLHSVGAKALFRARKSQLNDKKVYAIMDVLKFQWTDEEGKYPDGEYLGKLRKLVDLYRINLVQTEAELLELSKKHGIEVINGECERAIQTVQAMRANTREHDFVDMLYLAAVDPQIQLPKADVIFIDECQDLNKAQQAILRKMMKPTSRFIAVGDPGQAIYGFAGADVESFNNLKRIHNTIELPLSVNYRCGKAIVELAQRIVPQLQAGPNAVDGQVDNEASFKNIADGDMVLCRNVAPLVKMCLEFIRDQKKAYVKGGDIGKQLANLVTRSKAKDLDQFEQFIAKQLENTFSRLQKKYPYLEAGDIEEEPAYAVLMEKKIVLETIIDNAKIETPAELIIWIEKLFADDRAGVCFSSIHKSKGLENERVFIIERGLMPSPYAKKDWQKVQESNIEYVAYTRAKTYLGFVDDWEFKPNQNRNKKTK